MFSTRYGTFGDVASPEAEQLVLGVVATSFQALTEELSDPVDPKSDQDVLDCMADVAEKLAYVDESQLANALSKDVKMMSQLFGCGTCNQNKH